MDFGASLLVAIALVLILEGLLPLISPTRWREMFTQLLQLQDGQIRFFGLGIVMLGAFLLIWLI
ncbi:MAG: DUF2065 domain-containing protein [Betaproteobacteria bacterium]|nr:DUF2065 domain-containing protein [Betaproteobacteria bacterium]NDE23575.1 DUF2065 domain-containing protein [Betaproteobacteria bacterium]NDF79061.1 DUF2065 domain-containing protein [Betaproteobacteria bacterium]